MFTKIIIGFDGSDHSENALRVACDIAGKYGSKLYLVHTPQPDAVAFAMSAMAGVPDVAIMPSAQETDEAIKRILTKASGVAEVHGHSFAGTHTRMGEPADEVVAYATEVGADLIITGRRGLGGLGSLMQGSTSQRIGHLATCAVMTVV